MVRQVLEIVVEQTVEARRNRSVVGSEVEEVGNDCEVVAVAVDVEELDDL